MARTILDQKNDSDTNRWHRHAPNSTADLDALFAEENKGTPQWEKWGVFPDEEPPFTGYEDSQMWRCIFELKNNLFYSI